MNKIQLREALFRMDPIRNIVGFSDKPAFHIVITRGRLFGVAGPVDTPEAGMTANDSDFETTASDPAGRRSWFRRLLSALKA